ncbi:MAG: PQQ-dependent sugar dehydrogenase [Candidatus Spechtbacterales bacterium]
MGRYFTKKNRVLIAGLLVLAVAGGMLVFRDQIITTILFNAQDVPQDVEEGVRGGEDVAVVAEGLTIPWEIAFLPNGDMLVTERPGRLVRIGQDRTVFEIDGVRHVGEGGLLGLALHPNFEQNRYLYLYMTTQESGGLTNRVERYRFENDTLADRTEIIAGIPGASFHDGGRIAFGSDGLLYITTGDAGNEQWAQEPDVLAGKILRLNDDGSIPDANPFGNEIYSWGHRNPQGLAWDDTGQLWATEHGRSGVQSGFDELNRIMDGSNYGWPEIEGDETGHAMVAPVIHSGADYTWAPGGMAYFEGSIFFAGLRGSALYEAVLDPPSSETTEGRRVAELKAHFVNEFGRLRAVTLGPDPSRASGQVLYISTSNRDGRGRVNAGDDKIIRINPRVFTE